MTRCLIVAALLCTPPWAGYASAEVPDDASQADRLLFADRDWSNMGQRLTWFVEETGPEAQGFRPLTNARLDLTEVRDPADDKPMLQLRETAPGRDRIIGTYPLTVDPLLIYFLETTTRHMASLAHGSPDYIRNRIKSALRQGGAVVAAPDGSRMVILSPFLNDRNARRMGGFETMTLVISLAPDAHTPIRALQAAAPAAGYKLDIRGGKP